VLPSEKEENKTVGNWLPQLMQSGLVPHECGIFVRSSAQLNRARAAAEQAEMPFKVLDEHVDTTSGHVSISTMHLAKGLEFRAVAVMACDDEIIPLQERIETVGDDADLQDVYDTERQLLYVAPGRSRNRQRASSSATLAGRR
jgi:UvrD-like helicase C-terminal domain